MTTVTRLIERITPGLSDRFIFETIPSADGKDTWSIAPAEGGKVLLCGNSPLSLAAAYGYYLKHYLNINLSWCGSNMTVPEDIPSPEPYSRIIEQDYRVYMNYCTHSYSAAWWDWERWEREIDMMAMHGINMPLAITGTEAVWYKTLLDIGFTDGEARDFLCGPGFIAWELMTNLEHHAGPMPKSWIESHEALGKRILERELEFGMKPIQQGFSGFVPMKLKEKFPESRILIKEKWNNIGSTAELDPTDPLFMKLGTLFMKNLREIFGTYGFYAADPFHEGKPPVDGPEYLNEVGKTISGLFESFDKDYTWVMQAWSIRKDIATVVPKDHLLILDLKGFMPKKTDGYWGYPFVAGTLHNFGARMALHGDMCLQARNKYLTIRKKYPNICGSGLFMEGIGQNPAFYDLALEMLTRNDSQDMQEWLRGYCRRRYGVDSDFAVKAWNLLVDNIYTEETDFVEKGSLVCARPALTLIGTGPWDGFMIHYDSKVLPDVLELLQKVPSETDGMKFDRMDICRQLISNYARKLYLDLVHCFTAGDKDGFMKKKKEFQILLRQFDKLLSLRKEWQTQTWIGDARSWGTTEGEKDLYEYNARAQVTIWGNEEASVLFDYAWKEWSGLVGTYYAGRWDIFLDMLARKLEKGESYSDRQLPMFEDRIIWRASPFYSSLADWENTWVNSTEPIPRHTDVTQKYVDDLVAEYSVKVRNEM